MNFLPELATKVMAGEKTVTRRLLSDNSASPWYKGGCALVPGRTYAVCPGRGKSQLGRVRILTARCVRLGHLEDAEARREGFADAAAFEQAFALINGSYDPDVIVWRIEFMLPEHEHAPASTSSETGA